MQQLSTTRQTAYEVVTSTIRARGPFGLYKGLDSMVYFATPKAAIRFSGFEAASNSMRNADGSPMFGGMTSFCAGLVAGALEALFVTTPQARPPAGRLHGCRCPGYPSPSPARAAVLRRRRSRSS